LLALTYSFTQRICFQIEEAHWFYEDFIREINTSVPNLRLQEFIHQMFNHVPKSLISHIPLWKTENAFADFMTYKTRVPVRGCIMLNTTMDKCILVKGWKSGSSWSFPRGKIDQDEDDRDCAIREVYEETGFDLAGMVGAGDFIDINIRDQNIRLYIAPGVPQDYKFVPRTRKEISVRAFSIISLKCNWADSGTEN
jgi:mRNA-decapping enzyme subunit 2